MRKKTKLRIKIWVILAIFIISSTVLCFSCKSQEAETITIEISEQEIKKSPSVCQPISDKEKYKTM